MIWRILLASAMAVSLTISHVLPLSALNRFLVAGLLFAISARAASALPLLFRVGFTGSHVRGDGARSEFTYTPATGRAESSISESHRNRQQGES
jgi:hypothetical protein